MRNLRGAVSTYGQWKRVSIFLKEHENERKETSAVLLLKEEANDTPLVSLFIHHLHSTDIRVAHRSLFNRADCLGIHHQRHVSIFTYLSRVFTNSPRLLHSQPPHSTKHISLDQTYLAFSSPDIRNTWLLILRSYTTPDVYGRTFAPGSLGGLYRMSRHLDATIRNTQNLGVVNKSSYTVPGDLSHYGRNGHSGGGNPHKRVNDAPLDADTPSDGTGIDQDVFCELVLAGDVCGRTSVQRVPRTSLSLSSNATRMNTINFEESFTFPDLPPFGTLTINVYRKKPAGIGGTVTAAAKKSMNSLSPSPSIPAPSAPIPGVSSISALNDAKGTEMVTSAGAVLLIGSVEINLAGMRRGGGVEGMFAVLTGNNPDRGGGGPEQVGEIDLVLRVNE